MSGTEELSDINKSLKEVLKNSLKADGIIRGAHQVCKEIEKQQALLCILSENCDQAEYKKILTALCREQQVPLMKIDDNKMLGEWSGLCKIDQNGKARKVVGCSAVVIKDYGEESESLDVLKEYIKAQTV
uniref:40S ribosomal protein S12 n=1 Tax=Cuerna arida TaxID=1464854 RepID=A0A1B6GJI8_9HEMI